jgi:alginate O-acetyltransferase complex protein AlgI
MIFTTYWFLFFALLAVAVYRALPRPQWRLWWLAAACAAFHIHFGGPAGVLPIIALMVITYFAGRTRDRAAERRPAALLTRGATSIMPGAPPLGISFFTFEFVHYLFEVRCGGEPIRRPLKFLLFSIFFPSLVAGPIKRYSQFLPSLESSSVAPCSAPGLATSDRTHLSKTGGRKLAEMLAPEVRPLAARLSYMR